MSLGGGGVEMSRHEVTEIVSKRNHQISSSVREEMIKPTPDSSDTLNFTVCESECSLQLLGLRFAICALPHSDPGAGGLLLLKQSLSLLWPSAANGVWSLGVSLLIKYPPCTNGTLYYFSASMCLCLKCSGRLHYMRIWPSSLRNFAFMPEEKQPSVMTSPCAALPMSDDDRKKKTAFTAPTFPPSPGMV